MNQGNKTIIKVVLGFFYVIGGIFIAGIGVVAAMAVRNRKKIDEHPGQHNYLVSSLFGKDEVRLRPDTQNAYITVMCSRTHMTVPMPEYDRMNIELTSFFSKVVIDLPAGVTVRFDDARYADFSQDGPESAPVIHLAIDDRASTVEINLG